MEKLHLLPAMRAHRVEETGSEVVGPKGESLLRFGILENNAGAEGSLGLTREIEIMRGDMVRVLYETSLSDREKLRAQGVTEGSLTYTFGTTVTSLVNKPSGVDVTFSTGSTSTYDLVVGADGQNSSTRTLTFGAPASLASEHDLAAQVAYFTVPAAPTDSSLARFYFAPQSRAVMVRNGGKSTTQIYLFTTGNMDALRASYGKPAAHQKAVWAETFAGAGWEVDRFVRGMHDAKDFYAHALIQVKLPSLHKGRVALIGDAGYCPSVLTGKGTTSSFIGAYVLAGELARHAGDVDGALAGYEEAMREPVRRAQELGGKMTLPKSGVVVWAMRQGMWVLGLLGVEKLVRRVMGEGGRKDGLEGWELPEYEELRLEEWQ